MDLANSYEWAGWHGYRFWDVVMDPDGWDRRNLSESLLEPITRQEFIDRLTESTVNIKSYQDIAGKMR